MNENLRKYYERRLEMCNSQAWKDLMEDVEAMLVATNTLDGVKECDLRFKQGEVSIMRWLLSVKEMSEESFEKLKEER